MRNYIHTLLNLPAILAGKATKADLSQAKIDIGVTVDAIAEDNNRLAARIATLENLPAVKTGEPNLSKLERFPIKGAGSMKGELEIRPDAMSVADLLAYSEGRAQKFMGLAAFDDAVSNAKKPAKARKPRAPKGGAK